MAFVGLAAAPELASSTSTTISGTLASTRSSRTCCYNEGPAASTSQENVTCWTVSGRGVVRFRSEPDAAIDARFQSRVAWRSSGLLGRLFPVATKSATLERRAPPSGPVAVLTPRDKNANRFAPKEDPALQTRINDEISAPEVRLIDAAGTMIGVVSLTEALRASIAAELDLVEVSPTAEPPVCKIIDYGKHRYEQQKKLAEARKKTKAVELKEIKMRPGIDTNDYMVKVRNASRFLADGHKVKFSVRFQGREMTHQDIGLGLLDKVRDELQDTAKVELAPKLEGRQMLMVLSPLAVKT